MIFNVFTGTQGDQRGEGLHFVFPWVQVPTIYDVKTHTYTMSGSGGESHRESGSANDALTALTFDGLPVSLDLSVIYHVDPESVWKLHREIGPLHLEKFVRPVSRAQVRRIVAQYPVVDVYGGRRARIVEEINERLKPLFARNHRVPDEALPRDVRFSDEFQQAIEQKQVAQQNAPRMQYVLQKAALEKQQKILEAQGDARSIQLRGHAIAQNARIVEYEYARKIAPNVSVIVTGGRNVKVPFSNE